MADKIRKRERKCRSFITLDFTRISCLGNSEHDGDHYYHGVTDDKVPKPLRIEWHTFESRKGTRYKIRHTGHKANWDGET